MNVSRSRSFLALALVSSVTLAACGKKDEPAADTNIPVPAPTVQEFRVSDISTGKAIGADKRITDGTDDFGVRDTIYVAVTTEGSATNATLTAKWTFNGTQPVNESSETISPTGTAVTEFHITKPTAWPKGDYKVEIMVNGVPAGSKDFEIK